VNPKGGLAPSGNARPRRPRQTNEHRDR
jgi:hypothetical protein